MYTLLWIGLWLLVIILFIVLYTGTLIVLMTRPPSRKWGLWSPLGAFNQLVLQWLFMRLYYIEDYGRVTGWGVLYWVVPLSGWSTPYRFVGGESKHTRIV